MANTKGAIKRQKIAEKRHERNVAVKSATRTFVKKARTTIETNAEEAQPLIVAAISALDKAAKKGVIHKNNASRRKSRLMKALNRAMVQETAGVETAPSKRASRAKAGGSAKAGTTGRRTTKK